MKILLFFFCYLLISFLNYLEIQSSMYSRHISKRTCNNLYYFRIFYEVFLINLPILCDKNHNKKIV